jgi:hypothetical protein
MTIFSIEAVIESLVDSMIKRGRSDYEARLLSWVVYDLARELAPLDGTYTVDQFVKEVGERAKAKGWQHAPEGLK